jgi:hypothetical protein
MKEYYRLVIKTLNDQDIIKDGKMINRDLLIERFISPLLKATANSIPEDEHAIEINSLGNDVIAAYDNLKKIEERHKEVIHTLIWLLKNVSKRIEMYKE